MTYESDADNAREGAGDAHDAARVGRVTHR
jgi:hypothetical protein